MAEQSVVLLGTDCVSTAIIFNALKSEYRVARVVLEQPVPRVQFLKARVRRLGVRTVLGQVCFQAAVVPAMKLRSQSRIREVAGEHGLDDGPIDPSLVTRVRSANDPDTSAILTALAPAVIVVHGTRILSKNLLMSVPATFINMHAGITPLFRGVHGGYWALATGRPHACGVTVHVVDAGMDTGDIIAQAKVTPGSQDCFVTYPVLQLAAGLPLLKTAVGDAIRGRIRRVPPPPGESQGWSHPTLWQYVSNWLSRGVK